MEKEIVAALVAALAAVVSAVIAAWTAMKVKRIDEAVAIKGKQLDEALTLKTKQIDRAVEELKLWVGSYEAKMLEQRLLDYRKLWKLTESTSRRKVHDLTSEAANGLADQLTTWYYHEGGIVLSAEARDSFFGARNSLESPRPEHAPAEWRETVVAAFSALRTALCEDMNSRRGPTLRGGDEGVVKLAPKEKE